MERKMHLSSLSQKFEMSNREPQRTRPLAARATRGLLTALTFSLASLLIGCGAPVATPYGGANPTPVTTYAYLTGNWMFQLSRTSGPTPFTALSGFINETDQNPGTDDLTTAVFQATPASNCYQTSTTIPLQGSTKGNVFSVSSFSVKGQYLSLTAKKNAAADSLTGTYSVSDACAAESKGTLTGVKYASLTGTYSGSIVGPDSAQSMQLNLTQPAQGNGDGYFLMTGSATFTGSPCFTSGTVAAAGSTVIGNSVMLTIDTTGGYATQVVLTGTFDAAADTINLSSIEMTGSGTCSGSLGTARLTS
jgi:hypothetical protein